MKINIYKAPDGTGYYHGIIPETPQDESLLHELYTSCIQNDMQTCAMYFNGGFISNNQIKEISWRLPLGKQ